MEERDPRVEIREGESAAISCKARGKPLPTYSWIKASTREVNITFLTKIILYLIYYDNFFEDRCLFIIC